MKSWIRGPLTGLVVLTGLAGCSWFGGGQPEWYNAAAPVDLEVPEGLDTPSRSTALMMPGTGLRTPSVDEAEPRPPRVVAATAGAQQTSTRLNWSAAGPYLLVEDTPEGVARRLRFAIQRSGMQLVEQNTAGNHLFDYYHQPVDDDGFFESMMFWLNDEAPNFSGSYRVRLSPDGANTRVYLEHADGSLPDPDAAEHVLAQFAERLG